MAFRYHPPDAVTNPAKHLTSIVVLYDGGPDGFSLACIKWDGLEHMSMRWNVAFSERTDPAKQTGSAVCCGSPSVKGVPSWFILPRELFHPALFDTESSQFLDLVKTWQASQSSPDDGHH